MKRIFKSTLAVLLMVIILTGCAASPSTPTTVGDTLTQEQKNTVALLNYLAFTTEQIHSLPNSQAMLEDTFSILLSEFNLNTVDVKAKTYLDSIRGTIQNLLNIDARRGHLQYVYNQEKANALLKSLPSPLTIASLAENSSSPEKIGALAVSATFTVLETVAKYANATQEANNNYYLGNWELNEEQRNEIFVSRGNLFDYMWQVVHQYESAEEQEKLSRMILSEADIKQFVAICKTDSPQSRLEQLTDKKDTYAFFGIYWLELASCYFETGKYVQCLECITEYQNLGITIFKRDSHLLSLLPKAIVAAQNVYANDSYEYIAQTTKFAEAILNNAKDDNWSERYFAATTYLNLYSKTEDAVYLEIAFEIIKDNVTHLANKQKELNKTYLGAVTPIDISSGNPSDSDKAWANSYNNHLQAARATECPPIYQPLTLNCKLLFILAEELGIRDSEKETLQNILHGGSQLFLCDFVNNEYSYAPTTKNYQGSFNTDEFVLPASMLHQNSVVTVKIGDTEFTDVKVSRVERSGSDINSFKVHFTSDALKHYDWSADTAIQILIDNGADYDIAIIHFKVSKYNDYWIFGKTVEFEQYYP